MERKKVRREKWKWEREKTERNWKKETLEWKLHFNKNMIENIWYIFHLEKITGKDKLDPNRTEKKLGLFITEKKNRNDQIRFRKLSESRRRVREIAPTLFGWNVKPIGIWDRSWCCCCSERIDSAKCFFGSVQWKLNLFSIEILVYT